MTWLFLTGSALCADNFVRIGYQEQEILNFFNVKIAHMLAGLGIIRHWMTHLVCLDYVYFTKRQAFRVVKMQK